MKTIGVLGGLGPQATYDFEERVHLASQRLIPPHGNSGYPPMVVLYYRHAPVMVREDNTPIFPITPNPLLMEAASRLGTLADFIVIASNGVHLLQPLIEQAAGKPVLSMVELTLAEVERRGLANVGVLEFGGSGVYMRPLEARGARFTTLPPDLAAELDRAIVGFWEGKGGPTAQEVAMRAVQTLRAEGADGIIMGCTEIPLMLGEHTRTHTHAPDLINPIDLLAEAAVRHSLA